MSTYHGSLPWSCSLHPIHHCAESRFTASIIYAALLWGTRRLSMEQLHEIREWHKARTNWRPCLAETEKLTFSAARGRFGISPGKNIYNASACLMLHESPASSQMVSVQEEKDRPITRRKESSTPTPPGPRDMVSTQRIKTCRTGLVPK